MATQVHIAHRDILSSRNHIVSYCSLNSKAENGPNPYCPIFLLVSLLVVTFLGGCTTDFIHFNNRGNDQIGILVDGVKGTSFVNDYDPGPKSTATIAVGNFTSPYGEIIAFAKRRLPTLINGNPIFVTTGSLSAARFVLTDPPFWTKDEDWKELTFRDEACISVYFWIILGDPASQKNRIYSAIAVTSGIWREEAQGLCFSFLPHSHRAHIDDRTQDVDTKALGYQNPDFYFSCANVDNLKETKRFVDHAINIYYVSQVFSDDGGATSPAGVASTSNGYYCPPNVILMGSETSPALLAHEIGHALSLRQHTDQYPYPTSSYFDDTNVMHPASDIRQFLTEGQTFRAAFNELSVLNRSEGYAKPNSSPRGCYLDTDVSCPPLQKRIWRDGAWPPN